MSFFPKKQQNTTPVMQANGNETKGAYHWPDLSNLRDKSSVDQDHPGKSVSFYILFAAVRGFTKILEKRLIFYFQNDQSGRAVLTFGKRTMNVK